MAKLTGAKKKAFLERMEKGRRKAARANPKKKATTKKRKPAKKKAKAKNPTVRKSKKVIGKGFSKPVAAEWAKGKRAKAKKTKKARGGAAAHHNPGRKKRRNSDGAAEAAAMFETFHQMPPNRIIEYEELVRFPGHFAEIGQPLKELRVFLDDANKDFPFTRFGDCQVVCTPDGNNIYFVGGDQAIDLEALDITSDKDTIELGPCTYICYHTVKGFHDFTPTDYWHRFGEEDGTFPRLGYDRLNKRLFLIGGNYQVKREGIVN